MDTVGKRALSLPGPSSAVVQGPEVNHRPNPSVQQSVHVVVLGPVRIHQARSREHDIRDLDLGSVERPLLLQLATRTRTRLSTLLPTDSGHVGARQPFASLLAS